jgi:hypothetical protein
LLVGWLVGWLVAGWMLKTDGLLINRNGSTIDEIPRMMLTNRTFEMARNLSMGINAEHLRYLKKQLDDDSDGDQECMDPHHGFLSAPSFFTNTKLLMK